jgi:hypothetical protein
VAVAVIHAKRQVTVNNPEYFHEVAGTVAFQSFKISHKRKTVSAVWIIPKILKPVTAASAVNIDIAGGFAVFVQQVQKVMPDTPLARNVMPEYIQSVIRPFQYFVPV